MYVSDKPEAFAPSPAKLDLRAQNPVTEIQVFNANLDRVAHGFGSLSQTLGPGIYQVVYQAGSERTEDLISLKPGAIYEQADVGPQFLAAAPVTGSTGAFTAHQQALNTLTHDDNPTTANTGDIVVFVRAMTEGGALDLRSLSGVSLRDSEANLLATFDSEQIGQTAGWAALKVRGLRGGCTLRTAGREDADQVVIDQSLWIAAGWQTIVIIPSRKRGMAPAFASIHTLRRGQTWDPDDHDNQATALALEAILAALRQGRRSVSRESQELLLAEKSGNPMLSIVAAHSILLGRSPDWGLFRDVVQQLERLIPGHPDLTALMASGKERERELLGRPRVESGLEETLQKVSWPPMLLAGYRGLLRHDARCQDRGVIEANSLAERAASRLVDRGTWSAWEPLLPSAERGDVPIPGSRRAVTSGKVLHKRDALKEAYRNLSGFELAKRDWGRLQAELLPGDDAARRLVHRFLTEMAQTTDARTGAEFLQHLDPKEVSLGTGVPVRVAAEIIEEAKALTGRTPEPATVQAWLVVSDLLRCGRSRTVREYLDTLELSPFGDRPEVTTPEISAVIEGVRRRLATKDEWSAVQTRIGQLVDNSPLKSARELLAHLDFERLSRDTGIPRLLLEMTIRIAHRGLTRVDERLMQRMRATLAEMMQFASQTAAREFFEGLDVNQLSSETHLPPWTVQSAVVAISAGLPPRDELAWGRLENLKSEALERPSFKVAREFIKHVQTSKLLGRIFRWSTRARDIQDTS